MAASTAQTIAWIGLIVMLLLMVFLLWQAVTQLLNAALPPSAAEIARRQAAGIVKEASRKYRNYELRRKIRASCIGRLFTKLRETLRERKRDALVRAHIAAMKADPNIPF